MNMHTPDGQIVTDGKGTFCFGILVVRSSNGLSTQPLYVFLTWVKDTKYNLHENWI